MNKKEVMELKRRFKKDGCTFTRICGCYVNSERNKITDFGETFLNLDEDEFYKYLEIAKKTLSGSLGNQLLLLDFPLEEEKAGGRQQFLMGLRESRLKNEDLLERFYEMVMENYSYAGNYLILVFHDAYDVMVKTSDHRSLDESEEVYEYLLCAICPVTLSKPGLSYLEEENRIGPRIRDWVVGPPDSGFLFPAFTQRSTDIHSALFYTKDVKEPHVELMEGGLGCPSRRTITEQKNAFHSLIKNACPKDSHAGEVLLTEIQENLNGMVAQHEALQKEEDSPLLLTPEAMEQLMEDSNIPEEQAAFLELAYTEEFGSEPPQAQALIDSKALEANQQKKKELELTREVEVLKQRLEQQEQGGMDETQVKTYDVILRVKEEKEKQIKMENINGQRCLVIPMEDHEHIILNGVNM